MTSVLSNDIAEIIRQLIVDNGLDAAQPNGSQWPVYCVSHDDKASDELICVFSTTGRVQDAIQVGGNTQEQYGIQVKVRAKSIPIARRKIAKIVDHLDKVNRSIVPLDGVDYLVHACTRTSSILFIGYESSENVLPVYVANYTVTIT